MTMGLSTGYFIWNILSWLFIFLFTALLFCAVIYFAVYRNKLRMIHIPKTMEKDGFESWKFEHMVCGFRKDFVEPFATSRFCHAASLAAVAALLAAAILSGNGSM